MSRDTYFTVGPSQLYPTVVEHIQSAIDCQISSIYHRSSEFHMIYQSLDKELRTLMSIPSTHKIYIAHTASEIMERTILNLVEKKSFHFVHGAFSDKWLNFSRNLNKQTPSRIVNHGEGFSNFSETKIDDDVEMICITQNETSTGVSIPMEDIYLLKKRHSDKLICIDIVSSAPLVEIDFDYIDTAFFSVQKAFGLPSGLAIWIVNEDCIEKSKNVCFKGAHNTLAQYHKNYQKWETPSTPNVLGVYLLDKILQDLNKIGVENIRKKLENRAEILYQLPERYSYLKLSAQDIQGRSKTVIVFKVENGNEKIIAYFKSQKIILASGYGEFKSSEIRIGNFPAISNEEFEGLIVAFEGFKN